MAQDAPAKERSSFDNLNATRVIVTTLGVLFGISGANHGLFEFLQGNKPTGTLFIHAIGEAQQFWPKGTEDAFTILPTFWNAGLLSMIVGLVIVGWSLFFIETKYGRTVFLALSIILFLVGGGIGIFLKQAWSRPVIAGAAIFSSIVYILLWDGVAQKLHDKGGIGVLINLAILAVLLILRWPALG